MYKPFLTLFIILSRYVGENNEVAQKYIKEARNSFFGLGVYLLKSKFRIKDKLRFP